MRIIQLTPGSGDNFYCENCIRDLVLVRAVRDAGHDMLMVPMYLPLNLDSEPMDQSTPIFFGGLNVYFQQKFSLFRRTPRWFDRIFDSHGLLKWVGRFSGMTSASELGEMTLAMLAGSQGPQAKEVDRLIEFLSGPENRPDVLILSNMLLAGLAHPVKERLGCKLACWMQDEDGFVDGLGTPWTEKVWAAMKEIVCCFDMFLPVSHYYAKLMQQRLAIPEEKIKPFTPGIDISQYDIRKMNPDIPTLGFLGRMCPANGLDIAVSAYTDLIADHKELRLLVCGGKTSSDKPYIREQQKLLAGKGMDNKSEFLEGFDFSARLSFLEKLSVLCSPPRQAPACALNVMEATACGVPFVAPNTGVFTELAESTAAGVLYEPNNPVQLHKTLNSLLQDSARLNEMSHSGRHAASEHFDVRKNADEFVEILSQL